MEGKTVPMYEALCISCNRKYEWYSVFFTEENKPCPRCGGTGERLYSVATVKIFSPFVTRNIRPDGAPVEVKSQRQLSSLCNQYNLTPLDDPKYDAPVAKFKTPQEILGVDVEPDRRPAEGDACRKEDLMPC